MNSKENSYELSHLLSTGKDKARQQKNSSLSGNIARNEDQVTATEHGPFHSDLACSHESLPGSSLESHITLGLLSDAQASAQSRSATESATTLLLQHSHWVIQPMSE